MNPLKIGSSYLPILIWMIILVGTSPVYPTDQPRISEDIRQAHIEALGGREALAGIDSLHRLGTVTFHSSFTGTLEGAFELLVVPRQRIFQSSELGAFSTITAWDGEQAWERGPQGLRKLGGDERKRLAAQSHIFLTTGLWGSESLTIERLEDEELDGKGYYVLSYSDKDSPGFKAYLDKTTLMAAQIVMPLELPGVGQTTLVIDNWDYRRHHGVMFPDGVSMAIDGFFSTEVNFEETEINGEVDESRFAFPE